MKILHGLMPGQVLQRDVHGRAHARVRGSCKGSGIVEARILKNERALNGFGWKPLGHADDGCFTLDLKGIPSGGPYRIEMRVVAHSRVLACHAVENVFVGDVWILAGQSNMEGIGNMTAARKPHPMVRAFYMRDAWDIAADKLHHLPEAVDRVHNGYGKGPGRPSKMVLAKSRSGALKGAGPGHTFGIEMYKRTKVPQGLIACAHGGTSMAEWSPRLRDKGGDALYGAMLRRYAKLGQPIAGIVWYQGESDANRNDAPRYTKRMVDLVSAVRRDTGQPSLPWIMVQIGRHASMEDGSYWNCIQEQQRMLTRHIKKIDVVPSVDLELDDGIHIGGEEQQMLGRRLARAADRLVHKARGVKPAIVFDDITMQPTSGFTRGSGATSICVRYRNVTGKLESKGVPTGFSLHDHAGRTLPYVYRTTLDGHMVILHTQQSRIELEGVFLSYGHGRFPYCNIMDCDGMGLPVVQRLPVTTDHPVSCLNWQRTFLPHFDSIAEIAPTHELQVRRWRKAPLRNGFGVLPQAASATRTGVFLMRTEILAETALSAWFMFGANCPFKLWINGKSILQDLACTVPMGPDKYEQEIQLLAGKNKILVAMEVARAAPHFGISARIGTRDHKQDLRIQT